MKYWVFQNNQVTGPFDPEDLSQVAGYSGDTLICPEGRKGTNMGDWQRASMVPELSVSILKASQLALAVKGGGYPALPPEPTLKDLAALGSLQEKVSLLDNMVSHLQESLRLKDEELLSVHKELQEKARYAQDLAVKLGAVEERLSAINVLREGLDKAVAAEHDVESTVEKQSKAIDELKTQLEALRDEEKKKVEELESELERVRTEDLKAREEMSQRLTEDEKALADATARAADASAAAADAAAKAVAAKEEAEKAEAAAKALPASAPLPAIVPAPVAAAPLVVGPTPLDAPAAAKPDVNAALGLASERPSDKPALPPAPASAVPASTGGEPPWLQPAPLTPAPAAGGLEGLKPLGLETTPVSEPTTAPAASAPLGAPAPEPAAAPVLAQAAAPAPLTAGPLAAAGGAAKAPPKPAKKKAPLALIGAVVVGVVALGALKLVGPGAQRRAAPPPAPAAPLPPPEPPKPSPEEILEEQKKEAIELLRSWPLPDGAQVAVKLETEPTPPGGLSPWFADKIRDGLFQVNFYPPKDSKQAGQAYEFEVSLADHKVSGHNAAASALLAGKPAKAAKAKKTALAKSKPKKVKIKPKPQAGEDSGDVLGDALNLNDDSTAAPQAPSGGGDVLIDGSGAAQAKDEAKPAAPSKRKASARAKAPAPASDDPLAALVADDKPKAAKLPKAKPAAKQESLDDLLLPGVPKERPAAPQHVEDAAPADAAPADAASDAPADEPAPQPAKSSAKKKKGQPADAALLEDLLKP